MSDTPKPHLVTEMKPDIYLSPGFYMGFWENSILGHFTADQIKNHTKLQLHRELRVGAIMAAAQTIVTGNQYYVGIPATDPPDVLLMWQERVTFNGKPGTEPKYVHVEVTRCDIAAGETLIGQALNKNKPAYRGMVVAIDVDGNGGQNDYQAVLDELLKQKEVYPAQIMAVETVGAAGPILLPPGTFGLSQLWPGPASQIVHRTDTKAFFRRPTDVIGKTEPVRGVSIEWRDLGGFTLMPPTIP